MDIKYYYNCNSKVVEAINMDNVKRIYVDYYNCNSKKVSTLYFDDIKIHSIDKNSLENKINEIVNSENKILKIYNSSIIKIALGEENAILIFKNGFTAFKEFFQSSSVNTKTVFSNFKVIGTIAYIEQLKEFDKIGTDRTIDYIVGFVISFMYMKYIKELAE